MQESKDHHYEGNKNKIFKEWAYSSYFYLLSITRKHFYILRSKKLWNWIHLICLSLSLSLCHLCLCVLSVFVSPLSLFPFYLHLMLAGCFSLFPLAISSLFFISISVLSVSFSFPSLLPNCLSFLSISLSLLIFHLMLACFLCFPLF